MLKLRHNRPVANTHLPAATSTSAPAETYIGWPISSSYYPAPSSLLTSSHLFLISPRHPLHCLQWSGNLYFTLLSFCDGEYICAFVNFFVFIPLSILTSWYYRWYSRSGKDLSYLRVMHARTLSRPFIHLIKTLTYIAAWISALRVLINVDNGYNGNFLTQVLSSKIIHW